MRFAPALAALVVLAALASCSPVSISTDRPTRAWAAPILIKSDAEALAAAEITYTRYVETGEAILAGGGSNVERLRELSTAAWFESISPSYAAFSSEGKRLQGTSKVVEIRLQRWSRDEIVIYACRDYRDVTVISSDGRDVTPEDRPRFATFEVHFAIAGGLVLVSNDDLWSHGEWCF